MAETHRRLSIHIPWSTLLKIIAAVALVSILVQIWYILTLVLIAVIVAVGLDPAVAWLEARGWARWVAASVVAMLLFLTLVAFLAFTWTSISGQATDVAQHLERMERQVMQQLPPPVAAILKRSGAPDSSTVAAYAMSFGRSALGALAAFVLSSILVVYLLIEAAPTYQWLRGFMPAKLRPRFDRTASEARDVASAYIVANFVTSVMAGFYTFAWLTILDVPATLVLALLAFICDFIPVVGFFLACVPAMVMAATKSVTLALWMIPIYGFYHFIENYVIGPRIYARRLRLSNLAVLLAFAVGAELGGVVGALLAMPIAATYPTIEKLWLRGPLGDDVVSEHEAARRAS